MVFKTKWVPVSILSSVSLLLGLLFNESAGPYFAPILVLYSVYYIFYTSCYCSESYYDLDVIGDLDVVGDFDDKADLDDEEDSDDEGDLEC